MNDYIVQSIRFLKQSSVMKFMARWGIIYRLRAFDFIGILWQNLFLTAGHLHWFTKEGTEALKGQLHDMQAFCRTWLKMRIVSQPLHLDPSTTLGLPCYVSAWGFLDLEVHSRCFWEVRRGKQMRKQDTMPREAMLHWMRMAVTQFITGMGTRSSII